LLLFGAIAGARADSTLTNIFGGAWNSGINSNNGYFTTTYTPYLPFVGQDLNSGSNVTFGSFNLIPTFISGSHNDGFTNLGGPHHNLNNTAVTFFFTVNSNEYEVEGLINTLSKTPTTSINYNAHTGAGSSDSYRVDLTELLDVTTSTSTTNTSIIDPGTGNHSLRLGDIYVDTINYSMPNPFNGGTSIGGYINAVPEMGTSASMVSLICGSGLLGLVTRKRARSRA
jgi:hypothetical protein